MDLVQAVPLSCLLVNFWYGIYRRIEAILLSLLDEKNWSFQPIENACIINDHSQ